MQSPSVLLSPAIDLPEYLKSPPPQRASQNTRNPNEKAEKQEKEDQEEGRGRRSPRSQSQLIEEIASRAKIDLRFDKCVIPQSPLVVDGEVSAMDFGQNVLFDNEEDFYDPTA